MSKAEYMRQYRAARRDDPNTSWKIRGRAHSRAAEWVRLNHPDVWERILNDEWEKAGRVPQAGRPRRAKEKPS